MVKKIILVLILFSILSPAVVQADVYNNLQKLSNISYIAGKELYAKNKTLTAKQSYIACERFMKSYNKALAKQQNNPNYTQFLYYMSPAEVTYCWAGYLDAAGAGK